MPAQFYLLKPSAFTDPIMLFSMDLALDNTNFIGPLNGTLQGGASVISGVAGTAFYSGAGGGYLDLGVRPVGGCLHYPDDCSNGISIALWLKIFELPAPEKLAVLMHNGGCLYASTGYCLFLRHNGLSFTTRNEVPGFRAMIANLPLYQWYHVTVSHKDAHTAIFVNGCPAERFITIHGNAVASLQIISGSPLETWGVRAQHM